MAFLKPLKKREKRFSKLPLCAGQRTCVFSGLRPGGRRARIVMWTCWWIRKRGESLLDLSHLLQEMEELLGCRVHVVESDALHWTIRECIIKEAVPL